MGDLRYADRVVVFSSIDGRFRGSLRGTVMRLSTKLGRGERITVLLDAPTPDGFAVLEVPSAEVVRVDPTEPE